MWNDTSRNSIKFPEKFSIFAFISVDSPKSQREHSNVVRLPTQIFAASFYGTLHQKKGKTPWEHSLQPLSASVTTSIPAY
jgi:hypothetical protein